MKACLCGLSRCECHTQLYADCLGCDLIKELMSSFCVLVTHTPMCSYSHIYTDSFFISNSFNYYVYIWMQTGVFFDLICAGACPTLQGPEAAY